MATPEAAAAALRAARISAGAAYVTAVNNLIAAYKELAALDRSVTRGLVGFNNGVVTVPAHAEFLTGVGSYGPFSEVISARQVVLEAAALAA